MRFISGQTITGTIAANPSITLSTDRQTMPSVLDATLQHYYAKQWKKIVSIEVSKIISMMKKATVTVCGYLTPKQMFCLQLMSCCTDDGRVFHRCGPAMLKLLSMKLVYVQSVLSCRPTLKSFHNGRGEICYSQLPSFLLWFNSEVASAVYLTGFSMRYEFPHDTVSHHVKSQSFWCFSTC